MCWFDCSFDVPVFFFCAASLWEQVLSIIIDFCRHQESLIIRAMAEVTTKRYCTRRARSGPLL